MFCDMQTMKPGNGCTVSTIVNASEFNEQPANASTTASENYVAEKRVGFSPIYQMIRDIFQSEVFNNQDISLKTPANLEGFIAGTMVNTIAGYKGIEELVVGDIVIGHNLIGDYYERSVVAVGENISSQYIKIFADGETIPAAPNQKFYLPHTNTWIDAKDITPEHVFIKDDGKHCTVEWVEIVDQAVKAYSITVVEHEFAVTTNNIAVHNADFISAGAPIVIGVILAFNPITATIGTTVALGTLGAAIYLNSSIAKELPTDAQGASSESSTSLKTSLPERTYYESRKQELVRLKQKMTTTLQGIRFASRQCNVQGIYFSTMYFDQVVESSAPIARQHSPAQEAALNSAQQLTLRAERQAELTHLENEIINLHIIMAFHVNVLIERKTEARRMLDSALAQDQNLVIAWNANIKSTSNPFAMACYENVCRLSGLVEDLESKTKELNLAIEYYKNSATDSVIKNTTNISAILAQQEQFAQHDAHYVADIKKYIDKDKKIVESYFSQHKISAKAVEQKIKHEQNKEIAFRKSKELESALQEKAGIQYPKAPEDPDKDKGNRDGKRKDYCPLSNKEARGLAEKLGYAETKNPPFKDHGKLAFKKGNDWITPDRTGHNGGVWKLFHKNERIATYSADLTQIIGK